MTKQRSGNPEQAEQSSNAKPGTEDQTGGGANPSAGDVLQADAPTMPPTADNNNPLAPVAAVSIADSKSPHPAENSKSPIVADFAADEDKRDATDKYERRRKREPEPLNDAVGSSLVAYGWSKSTWTLKKGNAFQEFIVTRFYPTKSVAIDFPVDDEEAKLCGEKRAKLHEFGIAYVAIMPGKNMTTAEIIEAIDRERAVLIAGKGE